MGRVIRPNRTVAMTIMARKAMIMATGMAITDTVAAAMVVVAMTGVVVIRATTRMSAKLGRKKTLEDLALPPGELERMVEETRTAKVVRVIAANKGD